MGFIIVRINKNNYIYYAALLVWAVFSVLIIISAYYNEGRSVYPLYHNVGLAWNAGDNIYAGNCEAYSYWPGFALIFAVLVKLPYHLGSCVWTFLNLISIFVGLYFLGKIVFEECNNRVGIFLLLPIPLLFEGIFNQQSNSFVAGVTLIGAAYICKKRYMLGSVLMLFSAVSKIAPIAFPMLFLVLYPKKLWWRYCIAIGLILAVVIIFGGYDYVKIQHYNWINYLGFDANERWAYRDLFVLFELVKKGKISSNTIEYFPLWYRGVQLLGACVLCSICMWLKYIRKYGVKSISISVVISGSVWWLLLGPSTEIATCVAGAGVAGFGVILAKKARVGWWLMLPAYICVVLGSSGDYEWNMEQLTDSHWIYGMLPFGATLMYIWVCLYSHKALALTIEGKKVILNNE